MEKELTFKDVYMPPFRVGDLSIYGFSSNGTKTFTAFGDEAQTHMRYIIDLLNGKTNEKYEKSDVSVDKDKLYVKGCVIIVRGWGKLIGSGEGCYHLSPTDAAKIQDGFIQWVVDTITEDEPKVCPIKKD
jgi:hypothetical protein